MSGIQFFLEASLKQVLFIKQSHKEGGSVKPTPTGAQTEFSCVTYVLPPTETPGLQRRKRKDAFASVPTPELMGRFEAALLGGIRLHFFVEVTCSTSGETVP